MKKSCLVLLVMACLPPPMLTRWAATLHGKTYGEWSARWWKWVRSMQDPSFSIVFTEFPDSKTFQGANLRQKVPADP